MPDFGLLLLLLAAIACGWWLGRKDWRKKRLVEVANRLQQEYFLGLNYLLTERTDEAIETFIKALEVNSDTVETHLALAELFRRRGEVARAVQVHQTLLARPDLSASHSQQIQLGLAKDYLYSGLLDRAENLLKEVLQQPGRFKREALQLLMGVYQQERDWQNALFTGQQLLNLMPQDERVRRHLSHYACELAEQALQGSQRASARQYLQQALQLDKSCARAWLLLARLDFNEGNPRSALKQLRQFRQHGEEMLSEAVELLSQIYLSQDQEKALLKHLQEWQQQTPSTTIMLAIAQLMQRRQGDFPAGFYVTEQLKHRPTIKGMLFLIDLHLVYANSQTKESLQVLRTMMAQLQASRAIYQCRQCGFQGRQLHWQCPKCKEWGSVKPIRGVEGD
ncbi:lipopolysaccharide assembly protein LapB [Balneatrix alpica]|uniref:Lipopolysaccharide assembly protein B n=1 Tax=Balneatrix alpica TaxID=75684 RepID=A0ABV5Z7K8_9GAMM|nr:lipopolysaccharide assembly protein LapB [Balneatrix alpica]